MKKYRLTENTIEYEGRILYQIEALVELQGYFFGDYFPQQNPYAVDDLDFYAYEIPKGHLGGYIESEDNLSQYGNCWVGGDAKVFGLAKVIDNAYVSQNAMVYDEAIISGNANVYGNAKVSGEAQIEDYSNIGDYSSIFNHARISGRTELIGDTSVFFKAHIRDANMKDGHISFSHEDYCSISFNGAENIKLCVYKTKNGWNVSKNTRYSFDTYSLEDFSKEHKDKLSERLISMALETLGFKEKEESLNVETPKKADTKVQTNILVRLKSFFNMS